MDSFWEQHRTFVLKIAGGLGVVLVLWIIGESMHATSVSSREARNQTTLRKIKRTQVYTQDDIRGYQEEIDRLDERIRFVAQSVGEHRKGSELRRGLLREILTSIEKETEADYQRFLKLAQSSPVAAVVGLAGECREYLVSRAGLENVLLDEDLGFGRLEMEPGQLDRFLITLALITKVTHIAIEEHVHNIKSISIQMPPGGKFEGEEVFIREYPVSFELVGPSESVLRFLGRLNDPKDYLPMVELRRLTRDKASRDENVLLADVQLTALRINPDAPLGEGRR